MKEIDNIFIAAKNDAITYYQTLGEVLWPLSPEKPKKCQIFKTCQSLIKKISISV